MVVKRLFDSLKNEWLLNIVSLTHDMMKMDVEEDIRYYNHERLHIKLGDLTPINNDNLQPQVSEWAGAETILGRMKCGCKIEET